MIGDVRAQSLQAVVESIDLTTLCIKKDTIFTVTDWKDFCQILSLDTSAEFKNLVYKIDAIELSNLMTRFHFDFCVAGDDEITIRCRHWLDELPYKVHTRRELPMMLEGKKPLSVFSVFSQEGLENEAFAELVFDMYVEQGIFVKRQEYLRDNSHPDGTITIRYVFYALRQEEWRIHAFLFLRQATKNVEWNDSFERIEGSLLGYSESENNAYLRLINCGSGRKLW